jgi:LmbE family N-acetylglucosaminyl deacetylase
MTLRILATLTALMLVVFMLRDRTWTDSSTVLMAALLSGLAIYLWVRRLRGEEEAGGADRRAGERAAWVQSLGAPGSSNVLTVFDPAAAPSPLAPSDRRAAALCVELALGRTEWDRRLLQVLRMQLDDGAPVRVRERNLASLASPRDAFAARIARELARRLPGGRPGADRPFTERRYTRARLAALLDATGYDVERVEGRALGADWVAFADARPADPVTGFVACGTGPEAVASFEAAHAAQFAARDLWLAQRRPGPAVAAPRNFDAQAYAGRTVFVLAPHPDDEIVGAGGTLLRLARAGARVVCVLATDGASGYALRHAPTEERRTVRIAEAHAVSARAGFAELVAWQVDEAAFAPAPELAARLADLLARERPALVLTPFLTDEHAHHVAMSALLADALGSAPAAASEDCRVLGYEVWGAAPPDVVCDVTDLRAEFEALLWTYDTGMKVDDFVDLCTRRGAHHARAYLGRAGLAETFFACPARDYPALVRPRAHD